MSSYTVTTVSVPGAASTAANGINDHGQIVGSYIDSAGHAHGFIDTNGTFVTINVPGAVSTSANGINDFGQIVGSFIDSAGKEYGFEDSNGHFTTIDVPSALSTVANAINDSGQIVGDYLSPTATNDPNAVGPAQNAFEEANGIFTTLQAGVNDGIRGIRQPSATGINNSGVVVGTTALAPASFPYGWVYADGKTETLTPPAGSLGFGATGINNQGRIVGWYGQPNTPQPGGATFIDTQGNLALVTLPGTAHAINNQEQIVGTAGTAGFLATPAGGPVPCFCEGTSILTGSGEKPVETLRPGDVIRTKKGRLARVRWIGQRTVRVTEATAPICISADALRPGVPRRDVLLSPDHAVLIDDVLIPARKLLNGATIRRDRRRMTVTYVHVELDRHGILFADGLPAESYLDCGNRGQFDREVGVRPLFEAMRPDRLQATRDAYAAHGCAPFHLDGDKVVAAHRRLLQRAQALGWRLADDPALSVGADCAGAQLMAAPDCGTLAFLLPAQVRNVRIRSRNFIPSEMNATVHDGRRLGVALALRLGGSPLAADAFGPGWYPPEQDNGWRWTNGDAVLTLNPQPRPVTLLIRLVRCGATYWLPAATPAATPRHRRLTPHTPPLAAST